MDDIQMLQFENDFSLLNTLEIYIVSGCLSFLPVNIFEGETVII